ncbi:methylenetetrahydrofolate reductase (NADPH) [Bifidobacterium commune]|uniref:Methylenetetrahydrofolate reductase n=1 Tax=Bifidobacterium commune TaxID=1505727 RepID=A0A1C4H277_9BIFI|nr:methylenetetrahydrofolate reductase [Bifidobacterium commune]MBB2954863.1 methylenetetrahydrofolate reductase (NADPH) [Bifidobacterium commune]SCC78941.1 5,10-methylenetetrahydrofolate reductase (NAD(P)) [Bifidobacterium commune]
MHSPIFSLEVFPPKSHTPVGTIYDTLDGLGGVDPDFISVTYGHGALQDRSLTARIANTIRHDYQIPVVAHLTALYSDKKIIDEALGMFHQAGVSGVLVLRGDPVEGHAPCGVFEHSSDLAAYIHEVDPKMKIFGACYPECHLEASCLEVDVDNLAKKVDAGVTHLITQLFYNNDDFYRFLDLVRSKGIDVPIEAGIMPARSAKSINSMTARNGCKISPEVRAIVERWGDDPSSLLQAGIVYASEQIVDLVAHGVDGIHLYTMNRPVLARRIWANVESLFAVN